MLESLEPCVLIEPLSVERAVLPRVYFKLPGLDGLFHVDACIGKPSEMILPSLGVNEMESPIPVVEAVLDERAKHAVVLVHAVEQRANVAILA
jgi:hypothetical protein